METKVFSVKDGNGEHFKIINDNVYLFDKDGNILSGTKKPDWLYREIYLLPSTLIRKPKTDEELAEEKYPYVGNDLESTPNIYKTWNREAFLAGRKSVGGEFHLTREELELLISRARLMKSGIEDDEPMFDKDYLISSLTPPIYPHTITVEHDGNNYLWETLKASYE